MCSSTPSVRNPRARSGRLIRTGRLSLHRTPQGVPAHLQMPGPAPKPSCRRAPTHRRPADRAAGEHRPRRDQLVLLRPAHLRAVLLTAAPDPLEPDDEHRHSETRRVRSTHPPPAMPDRQHAARRAARRLGAGLDRNHQLAVTSLHVQHMHTVAVEHGIGPGTPRGTRTTSIVVHVGVFFCGSAWSLSIVKTPTLTPRLRRAEPRNIDRGQINHAHRRRARNGRMVERQENLWYESPRISWVLGGY
jgi:hypothetical protein